MIGPSWGTRSQLEICVNIIDHLFPVSEITKLGETGMGETQIS